MKKTINLFIALLLSIEGLFAQRLLTDRHIINQQERMVFKSWDMNKFTPTSGFLGLNPEYWLTWGLHPNYPKSDLRPLSIFGPQSQRMSLVLAMEHTDNAYKAHSDTLSTTARVKAAGQLASLSDLDPLWQLYYKAELRELTGQSTGDELSGLDLAASSFLVSSGLFSWYNAERESLKERLNITRTVNMERGSRILSYHRLLLEHRKLIATWQERKRNASKQIKLSKLSSGMRAGQPVLGLRTRSDIQIADEILKHSKL